jgi:hypothetical protein
MTKKLRLVGLAVVAVCAFGAISAGAAQADTAHWTVNETTLGSAATETVKVAETNEAFLLKSASGIEIKCTSVATTGGKIFETNKDSVEELTFSGCTVAEAPLACQVDSTESPEKGTSSFGTIKTAKTKEGETIKGLDTNLVVKTSAATPPVASVYDIYTPTAKDTSGNLVFAYLMIAPQTGKSCPVSGNYEVTGTAAGQVPVSNSPSEETVNQLNTFSPTTATEAGAALKLGTSAATLTGKASLALTGANAGKRWGVEVTNP